MALEKCAGGNDSGCCCGMDTSALTLTGARQLFLITLPLLKNVSYFILRMSSAVYALFIDIDVDRVEHRESGNM
jgi:hypothetical protein